MVVVCGTATTIDFLSPEGVFKGGTIMPGVGLMLRSLHEGHRRAARPGRRFLRLSDADRRRDRERLPARAGRRDRAHVRARVERQVDDLTCLVSGGAARAVLPRLAIPHQYHENLVLEGLYRVSMST